jgi:selenocysteine-specific elongation factor
LNLAGIEAKEITRGMVLAAPGLFKVVARLDCSLNLLPSARPLKNRAKVHFHSGTAETVAEVVLLDSKELAPGMNGYAQLRLTGSGLFLPGDRFILRQFSPVVTIGGGVVLDNFPGKHRLSDPAVPEFLSILERGNDEERLERLVGEMREADVSALTARMGRSEKDLNRLGRQLQAGKRVVILGKPPGVFVRVEHFQEVAKRAVAQLEDFHARNPLMAGIVKGDLRGRLLDKTRKLPSMAVFDAVLQRLAEEGKIELKGEAVQRAGREISLSPEELAAQKQIANAFESAGLAVPPVGEVLGRLKIDRRRAEKLLQKLLKEKVLVKVAADLVFHQMALNHLRELMGRQKAKSNRINVAIFKDLTGLTRKYAIPLLEYLDRERVTRREGDERVIL